VRVGSWRSCHCPSIVSKIPGVDAGGSGRRDRKKQGKKKKSQRQSTQQRPSAEVKGKEGKSHSACHTTLTILCDHLQ
jgi:hypothetical protein